MHPKQALEEADARIEILRDTVTRLAEQRDELKAQLSEQNGHKRAAELYREKWEAAESRLAIAVEAIRSIVNQPDRLMGEPNRWVIGRASAALDEIEALKDGTP